MGSIINTGNIETRKRELLFVAVYQVGVNSKYTVCIVLFATEDQMYSVFVSGMWVRVRFTERESEGEREREREEERDNGIQASRSR